MARTPHLTEVEFLRLERNAEAIERLGKDLGRAIALYGKDPDRYLPQLENARAAAHDAYVVAKVALRTLGGKV